jgi:uncharacterized membrane protein YdbT with pleckstrin-like domain
MSELITDQTYPIQSAWTVKLLIKTVILAVFFVPMFIVLLAISGQLSQTSELVRQNSDTISFTITMVFFLVMSLPRILKYLFLYIQKNNFSYSLQPNFITISQGVFSRQERNIPYSTIQNLYVKQDFWDRVLGICTFSLENAAAQDMTVPRYAPDLGLYGNQVVFPGLTLDDAEAFKGQILTLMKANPASNSLSGL